MVIETPRTILRHLEDSDLDAFASLTGDPDSMQYMGDGQPLTREVTQKWVETSRNAYGTRGYGCMAVIDKASGAFIGFAGYVGSESVTPPDEGEFIYALVPAARGRGLATEIAAALVDYGFTSLGFKRILLTVDPRNTASIHVIEKAGFTLVETKPDEHGMETRFYWRERP